MTSRTVANRTAVVVLMLLAPGACSSRSAAPPPMVSHAACATPLEPYLRVDLYTDRSNRNAPSGELTDDEWKRFVEEVLVQHFPDGGTVLENSGWWRRPNGTTFHGVGRTLIMLIPAEKVAAERTSVRAVIAEIKARYGPSSVGWEEDWVCATF